MGLGSASDVTLVQAREKASELRNVLANHGDPWAHRERKVQEQALQDARSITFEEAARDYHERHKPKWRSKDYARQWIRALELHAFPKIGSLNIGAVDLADVQSVIEPLEPIRKVLESEESVVIHCAAPSDAKEGARCGRRNIDGLTTVEASGIRAI